MERPRLLVVGTGSVGARHIRNLLSLGADVSAFSYRAASGAGRAELPQGVHVYSHLDDALSASADAVVVANPTEQHVDVALSAAQSGRHLFIEKPLSNSLRGVDSLVRLVRSRGLSVETGFMLRFHPNLAWIKTFLQEGRLGELYSVRAWFGQYLPDWRPGSDYRRCYSAKRLGGGVILDVVHELDLMQWLFGAVDDVSAMTRHTPSLGIESEAIGQIGLRFGTGMLGQVHLDYLQPVAARGFEIVGSEGVLNWDYPTGTVSLTAGGAGRIAHQVPVGFERNDMFIDYMRHFLNRLSDRTLAASSSLEEGVSALRLALSCHLSNRERRWVAPREVNEDFSVAATA